MFQLVHYSLVDVHMGESECRGEGRVPFEITVLVIEVALTAS